MSIDVIQLTKDMVALNSVSHRSNAEVSDLIEDTLKRCAFEVERLEFVDENGERKVSLVGKKGEGKDGFGLFSHSDTVPGDEWDSDPFDPVLKDGAKGEAALRLIGLGSCDMKGPLAATIAAAADVEAARLKKPLFIVITADEETTCRGARQVAAESSLFNTERPKHGVIAEPTQMIPVYAHKGAAKVVVTAHGVAAHTSTDKGVAANFLIAPFLAEMAELAQRFKSDESFRNNEFNPPTIGFNMILNDGGCKPNVTAAKTVCTLSFRTMPNDRSDDVLEMLTSRAKQHGFEVSVSFKSTPFYVSPDAEIVQAGLQATGIAQAETVPYGTDAAVFKDYLQLVILGPGNIAQAHTVGEWIDVAQLHDAVEVYKRMMERLCR